MFVSCVCYCVSFAFVIDVFVCCVRGFVCAFVVFCYVCICLCFCCGFVCCVCARL